MIGLDVLYIPNSVTTSIAPVFYFIIHETHLYPISYNRDISRIDIIKMISRTIHPLARIEDNLKLNVVIRANRRIHIVEPLQPIHW